MTPTFMASRAAALLHYLRNRRSLIHAALIRDTVETTPAGETVEFEVDVSLPQRPVCPIAAVEQLRVFFPSDDGLPSCKATRAGFPRVPHLNLGDSATDRSLCLYERPWSEEKSQWGPGSYVERIRTWLSDTASGTLHRDNQPLEPLLFGTNSTVVVPDIPLRGQNTCWMEEYSLFRTGDAASHYIIARSNPTNEKAQKFPFLVYECAPSTHGIIQYRPSTLLEIARFVDPDPNTFMSAIAAQLSAHSNKLLEGVSANYYLVFLLLLPKTRTTTTPAEVIERWVFIATLKNADLLPKLGIAAKDPISKRIAPLFGELHLNSTVLNDVPIEVAKVVDAPSRKRAAQANGEGRADDTSILMVGVGALGSQLFNNLARAGFGKWTLIDSDRLLPHNTYRHSLGGEMVAVPKADALAGFGSVLFDDNSFSSLPCDVTNPGPFAAQLNAALQASAVVVDCSASITTARNISRKLSTRSRRISIFTNPTGTDSVVLAEDTSRASPLEWLEAEYYLATAVTPSLHNHLISSPEAAEIRYGNSCRDLSAKIPQDFFAIHAGLTARGLRTALRSEGASITVSRLVEASLSVSTCTVCSTVPLRFSLSGWDLFVSRQVIQAIAKFREAKLPKETGGVLVGTYDPVHCFVAVVAVIPAPADSIEYPSTFIRGKHGLAREVNRYSTPSLGNLVYIGEWHSHPRGATTHPSSDDRTAAAELSQYMDADGKPTVMLIVGDNHSLGFLFKTPSDINWETLTTQGDYAL